MIFLYILISLLVAFLWFQYFREIDIYNKSTWSSQIFAFVLGGLSIFITLGIKKFQEQYNFETDGDYLNLFVYTFVDISLIEEFSKVVAFVVVYIAFEKQFHEPLDYIIHISLCALGFACVGNVLCAKPMGVEMTDFRAVLPTFVQIFNSSITAYGIIYILFVKPDNKYLKVIFFFLLSVISNGVYQYILLLGEEFYITFIAYFLFTVSAFSTVLNNALNFSPNFSYTKLIFPESVFRKMLIAYSLIMALEILAASIIEGLYSACLLLFLNMITSLPLVIVLFLRLSRFTLNPKYWRPIRIEFPFSYVLVYSDAGLSDRLIFSGNGEIESVVGEFFEGDILFCPISSHNSFFESDRKGILTEKIFLYEDAIFYRAKIYNNSGSEFTNYIVKAKGGGIQYMNDEDPIVAVLEFKDPEQKLDETIDTKSFYFVEWCSVRK